MDIAFPPSLGDPLLEASGATSDKDHYRRSKPLLRQINIQACDDARRFIGIQINFPHRRPHLRSPQKSLSNPKAKTKTDGTEKCRTPSDHSFRSSNFPFSSSVLRSAERERTSSRKVIILHSTLNHFVRFRIYYSFGSPRRTQITSRRNAKDKYQKRGRKILSNQTKIAVKTIRSAGWWLSVRSAPSAARGSREKSTEAARTRTIFILASVSISIFIFRR